MSQGRAQKTSGTSSDTAFATDSSSQLSLPGLVADDTEEWVLMDEDTTSERDRDGRGAFSHVTVLRSEVATALTQGREGPSILVDATLGGGGHTEAILRAAPHARVIGFDRDEVARASAQARLSEFGDRLTIVAAPFSRLREELTKLGIDRIDGICADLGVSSPQLDEADRGMSFRREGPIDMRMDRSTGETALDLIARMSDDELANVIFQYGEERRSRRIARSLKRAESAGELVTTLDLRRAIVRAVGPVRVGGVDPATRTFQALRIAVNDELGELEGLLAQLPEVLTEGGTAAIITFHSLEDRLVKHAFKSNSAFTPSTKKPILPTDEEQAENARSRSAKLRVAVYAHEEVE
ncbi:MAG: 16S rRNA (cytosine(1402)-N(4))-methyltransferase RsmH [Polyangiaceae bacterium]